MPKRYDRAYFDRWYRGEFRVNTPAEVRRKAAAAVSLCEYFMRRPVRSVLDVACGEGRWLRHLRELRPGISYTGVDSSAYAIRRFGKARNIRQGSFGQLSSLELAEGFDLVVCADAMHYVPDGELVPGLAEIARLCRGVAYLEVLTVEDSIVGDLDGFIQRPGAWYRKQFRRAGFVPAGPYCWASGEAAEDAAELEIPG